MLLDRQDGQVRRGPVRKAMIRSMCPVDLDDVEQFGFPIFVDGKAGSLPHKPLCFLCGSAGIEQVLSFPYLFYLIQIRIWLNFLSNILFWRAVVSSVKYYHFPGCIVRASGVFTSLKCAN